MYPSADEWTKKKWYMCIIKYYSAMRKKEVLLFVTAPMDSEGIMLSEMSDPER